MSGLYLALTEPPCPFLQIVDFLVDYPLWQRIRNAEKGINTPNGEPANQSNGYRSICHALADRGSMIHWPKRASELLAQGFNIHGCKKISIFVWNATHHVHAVALLDPHKLDMVMNLQVLFMTYLNHALLPIFIKNQLPLIINVSGVSGHFPFPLASQERKHVSMGSLERSQ
jgi:hypothetical protein